MTQPSVLNSQPAEAIVAGHICLDIIPTLFGDTTLFMPGRTVEAGPAVLATGGVVANTGLALHRLGVTTRLIGKVGADLFGDAIRRIVESHGPGLADGMVIASDQASSYTIILSPPGADRQFIHYPGCNATFGARDLRDEALTTARLLHFGYPPLMERIYRDGGAELVMLFQRAKAIGVTTSLDLSMPDLNGPPGQVDWPTLLAATLPYVDIFLPSVEELLLMFDRAAFERLTAAPMDAKLVPCVTPTLVADLGHRLLDMGAAIVGLKAGPRGFYLRTAGMAALERIGRARPADIGAWADRELWAPCYAATVVGTTGAGDAAIAGFLMALLRGMTADQALSAACAVGACNVEAPDALSGVRSWPETVARMDAGWPRLSFALDAPGWHWDESAQVWVGPADQQHQTDKMP